MAQLSNISGLHLVAQNPRREILDSLSAALPAQLSMFPTVGKRIIVFVVFSRLSDGEFIKTLQAIKPHVLLDIRRFPRFDNGKLNRALAFELFEKAHIKYVDMLWSHNSEDHKAYPLISSDLIAVSGSVMILIEDKQCSSEVLDTVVDQISSRSNKSWDIYGIPDLCSEPMLFYK